MDPRISSPRMDVSASPRRHLSDVAGFINSIIPEFALGSVRRLFTLIAETDGQRLWRSGLVRPDLTTTRIISILDKSWKDRDPVEVEIVQRWLDRESLLVPSASLLDCTIAAWAVEIAVVDRGEIVQPATGSETQVTVDLILCVVKGSVRITMNETQFMLNAGDTLITDEAIEITALAEAAFLWLPKLAAYDAAEALWRRRLDALSPLIGRLLPSWTTDRLIQLIDAMSPAQIVPVEPFLFHQGDPAENVFVIAAGSVIESAYISTGNEEDSRQIHVVLDSRQMGDFIGLDACDGLATYAVSAEARGVIAYAFQVNKLKRYLGFALSNSTSKTSTLRADYQAPFANANKSGPIIG